MRSMLKRPSVSTLLAGVMLAVCGVCRPDVAIGLVVLGAIFVPLERRWPIVPSLTLRTGWQTDVVHFVVDQVLGAALVGFAALALVPYLEPLLPNLDSYVHGPFRWTLAAIIGEVAGYWGHRMMHRVPWLWRLHSVHHSSPAMDWLAPNRRHVLDTALGQAASVIPLLALGLSPAAVTTWFIVRRAQGLFVHANLRVHLPVLRWIVATPEFHHWHHSADPAYYDKNFAGQCPFVDLLFGTLHMPAYDWPASYGLASGSDPMPIGYLSRLAWPFRDLPSVVRVKGRRSFVVVCGAIVAIGGVAAVAHASDPGPIPWSYVCVLSSSNGPIRIDVGPAGVIVTDGLNPADLTNVRAVDGNPERVVGLRAVRHSGAPFTLRIDASVPSKTETVSAQMIDATGTARGSCLTSR